MDNVDLQVLGTVAAWRAAGRKVVMGTVVRTWGSAPRPAGAIVAMALDGEALIAGSVSGGCIEDDLLDRLRKTPLAPSLARLGEGLPQRIVYGVSAEEANRFGLPCGGTIELVLEAIGDRSKIEELLAELALGRRVDRTLDLATGAVRLEAALGEASPSIDDTALVTRHGPAWRLLVIGAGQMSQYLAEMAVALGYQVVVCDPREEYAQAWRTPNTTLVRTMPDDVVVALRPDAHTAIVALTHDPKLDDLALIEALKSPAFYVGAIGSRSNQQKRRARLVEFDLTPEQLGRLHGPVGIRNGARTPPEIAVAILAHMTAERYGYRIPQPSEMRPAARESNDSGARAERTNLSTIE